MKNFHSWIIAIALTTYLVSVLLLFQQSLYARRKLPSLFKILPIRSTNSPKTISTNQISNNILGSLPGISKILPVVSKNEKVEVDFEFGGSGIRDLCDQSEWVEGRVIMCNDIMGGVGNVRNAILLCLRYSIALGASSFVMPSMHLRGSVALGSDNLVTGGMAGMEYLFDVRYFKNSIHSYCPQMHVYETLEEIVDYQDLVRPDPFNAKDIYYLAQGEDPPPIIPGETNDHFKSFREDFNVVMGVPRSPTLYQFKWPLYFEWQVYDDPVPFRNNFGRILKFRTDVRELASEAYLNLTSTGRKYYGVHLRAEKDVAGNEDWISLEEQIDSYTTWCEETGSKIMYAAGGDAETMSPLIKFASSKDVTVVHKSLLLSQESLSKLLAMPFDVQALVDYLILLKGSYFAGVGMSSFSANIAIRRHLVVDDESQWPLVPGGDGYSRLIREETAWGFVHTVWP